MGTPRNTLLHLTLVKQDENASMIKYAPTNMKKINTMPRLSIWDVVLNPKPCILALILYRFFCKSSLSEILDVMELTSITLNEAMVYIYTKKNCAFPGISQSTRGIIDTIYSPLIIPQSIPKAVLKKRLNTKLLEIIALVLLIALSTFDKNFFR